MFNGFIVKKNADVFSIYLLQFTVDQPDGQTDAIIST